jgi:alpha-1,3-rhamnosyl/mannosyltransferase
LPEVVGDAGVLVSDAEDPGQFADALAALYESTDHRIELTQRGLKRAGEFSWERCAHKTLQVYESV